MYQQGGQDQYKGAGKTYFGLKEGGYIFSMC